MRDVELHADQVGEGQRRADAELRAEHAAQQKNLLVDLLEGALVVDHAAGRLPGDDLFQHGHGHLAGLSTRGQPPDAVCDRIDLVGVAAQETVLVFRAGSSDIGVGKGAEIHYWGGL